MPRILYCRCAYAGVVPEPVKDVHLERLCAGGEAFEAVPDLCEMAARRDPELARIAGQEDLTVIACHPRAVKGLFTQAGCALDDTAEIVNMRAESSPT